MPTKKKTKKAEKEPLYQISLEASNEKLESSGDTALEALLALPKPRKMTTKVIFRVSYGNRLHKEVMMPTKAKRIFYPLAQRLLAKNLTFLLTK